MCSSTVSDTANRLRKTRKKKSSAVLLISERSHIGNLRQIRKQGKGRSSKRKENRRLSFLFAPAAGAATLPPSADGESPAEVQRKTPRPSGRTRLRQFVCPAQPMQKRSRPSGANTLTQFVCPAHLVPRKQKHRRIASTVLKVCTFTQNEPAYRHPCAPEPAGPAPDDQAR